MSLPTLLTDREFAALVRVHPKTMQKWIRQGRFEKMVVRIGDQWRFPEDRITEFIQKGGMRHE